MKLRVGMWLTAPVRPDAFRLITRVGKKTYDSLFFYGDELRPGICAGLDKNYHHSGLDDWIVWDSYKAWPEFVNGMPMIGEKFITREGKEF